MLGLYDNTGNNNNNKKKKCKYNNKKKKKKKKRRKRRSSSRRRKEIKRLIQARIQTFGEGCELQVLCKGGAKRQKTLNCGKIRGVNLGSCEKLHHRKK